MWCIHDRKRGAGVNRVSFFVGEDGDFPWGFHRKLSLRRCANNREEKMFLFAQMRKGIWEKLLFAVHCQIHACRLIFYEVGNVN